MRRHQAITILRERKDDLRRLGVTHLALFGSLARDDSDSGDADVIVDSNDGQAFGVFRLIRVKEFLEQVLKRPVDIVSRRGLANARAFQARIESDIVNVF